jgi:gliding motility-associated-like protein
MKKTAQLYMRKLTLCLFFLTAMMQTHAQDFSNKGKEFWLAYCYHVGMINAGGPPTMTLYITSDQNTNYTVEAYGLPTSTLIQNGNITAGQVITVNIPSAYYINDEGTFNNKAIRVTAQKPVVVYSYITRSAASGATVCLPVNVLGKEYYSMNFTQASNEANSNSFLTIIAVEDNTTLEITPSVDTKGGWLANTVNNVVLNKGQIFQVLGTTSGNNGGDLTGTKVRSISGAGGGCQKIAVFSGSGKIRIPASCGQNSSDNLYQQLYSTGTWGKKYITVPSYNRPNNYFRIARQNATTNVFLNGTLIPSASFTNGFYYQFQNNTPNLIEADQPICVGQYFTTQSCDGNGSPYDPDMIMLNPVEQNISKVTLVSSNLVAGGPQHHLHAVMKNTGTGLATFRFDGNLVPIANWSTVPTEPNYSYLYLNNVTQGYHTLASDSGFNATAYGYANAETYGYSAGSNVKDLYQFVSVQNQDAIVTFPAACKSSPFYVYQTLPYQPTSITWHFYGLFPDYIMGTPVHDSTYFVSGRQVWRYKIPTPYVINTPGTYPITVEVVNPTADGCGGLQEIDYDLEVFPPPVADFDWNHSGCVTDTVYFNENSTNTGGRPVYKWRWLFHDNSIDSIKTPKKLYSAAGNFDIKLQVVTDVGCRSDTIAKTIAITTVPIAAFTASTPRCPGLPITFNSTSTVNVGTLTKWVYNWGDGSPVDTFFNGNPITHTYLTAGTYSVTHSVYTNSGCRAVTAPFGLVVNRRPVANFLLPANVCLPQGLATFNNTTTISDGTLPLMGFQWNFGDASPVTTTITGTHNYSAVGPFNVQLIATSNNGCADTSVKVFNNIRPRPTAGFTNNPEVCLKDSLQFTDASNGNGGTIQTHNWDFGDATTSTLANPKKRWATPGTKTVRHWIVTDQGCNSDTLTKTIYVNAMPVADFNFANLGRCARQPITFNNASTSADGVIVEWKWDFGDASPIQTITNGNPVQHIYTAAGSYNVKLIVKTDKSCSSDTLTKVLVITATPVAGFTPPGGICLPTGFAQFTNTTTIGDGTLPTVTYNWNFGDGSPVSTLTNPSHNYPGTGPYNVQLIATSAIGCKDTNVQILSNIFPQPHADFSSNPEICLSDSLQFNDISVSNGGTVNEWHWDFGDATTSTLQSPKKKWATNGTKTVTLWVKTTNGCTSDTMTKTIFVNQLPTANFTVSAVKCAQGPVTFTSTSVANDGNLTEWIWNFGDGSLPQTLPNGNPLNHVYATAGTYQVKLVVKTNKGCISDTTTIPVVVNVKPAAGFTFPANICLPAGATQFTNTTSISDGTLAQMGYVWNFGDATPTSTLVNPLHNYGAVGPFTVQMVATSNNGCRDTSTQSVNTIRPQPTAGFTNNAEVCLSDSLQFTDASNGNGGNITGYNWDFGDGTTSIQANPKKQWTTPGTKTIKHWIVTDQGCNSDTLTKTIFVNRLPTPAFTFSAPQCEGKNIRFTDASIANDGTITTWNWNMGDGTTFNNANNIPFDHSYTAVGTYNVSLSVTTNKGCTSNPPLVKPVDVYHNPVVNYSLPEICLNDPLAQFFDSSTIADGTQAQFTYLWTFGDPNANAGNPNTSTVKNATHQYSLAQNYNMSLEVTSNQGCKTKKDTVFTVNGATPVANFTVQNPGSLCSNQDVVIQNTSTVNFGTVTYLEIYWDWGNNPTLKTVDQNPTPNKLYNFDYPDFGLPASKTYTVRLVAYSGSITGPCVNARQSTITVLASPTVRFDPVPEICQEEPAQQLTQAAETTGIPGIGVFTGPGITGTQFNPAVAGVGTHTIRYTFNATNGCTTFREQTVVVNPTPNVNAGPDRTVLEGGSVVILASSSTPGVTFLWTPATRLSNTGIIQPSASPADDITYTITATTAKGCEATDQVFVKVLKGPRIPNAFSPNGDGINDRWEIEFLDTYAGCTVEVYNIYGQIIFRNTGYTKPWDGNFNGKPMPVGTYYYIIEPKNGRSPITGYVGIVR